MNIPKVINSQKLYDLYEQIFDYFSLTVYDLESKIDTNLNISNIKNKLETFSDKHFKNALNDFNQEVKKLKNHIPDDFLKIEQISQEHVGRIWVYCAHHARLTPNTIKKHFGAWFDAQNGTKLSLLIHLPEFASKRKYNV